MSTNETVLISCVIPCYHSAETIGGVVDELSETLRSMGAGFEHEIILVNDGSPDQGATARTICEIARNDSSVVAIDLERNFGQHSALMAGLHQARGQIVVCLDDDGQTPADETPKLIEKVLEGFDIVYASYGHSKQHAAWRNWGSRFNAWCNHRFMGIPRDLEETSFFACKRFVVDAALSYDNPYPFVQGLLFRSVQTYCNVPVNHRSREVGESGYTMRKLLSLWASGVTAFSVLPLRAASVLGFIFAVIGFIMAIVIVIQKLAVPGIDDGWSSLMAGMVVIGGLIMMMLGLLGEYVGRIYMGLNRSPQYVVRDSVDRRDRTAD